MRDQKVTAFSKTEITSVSLSLRCWDVLSIHTPSKGMGLRLLNQSNNISNSSAISNHIVGHELLAR